MVDFTYPRVCYRQSLATDEKGNPVEHERWCIYPENELSRSRLELGKRLQSLLSELETEYELRKNSKRPVRLA